MTTSARQKALDHLKRPPLRVAPKSSAQADADKQQVAAWLAEDFTKAAAAARPGDVMPDGTVYAGRVPDTAEYIFVTPRDLPNTMTYGAVERHLQSMNICGHSDWQIPAKEVLAVLFNNRAAIKNFNETPVSDGPDFCNYYWSSTEALGDSACARDIRFSDGKESWSLKSSEELNCRPVRLVTVAIL